ncbi:MAG: helix-turn-helix transcriptional regulator [Telmatospirillum sp.]|nr:helix-turn-helix transcriptional regulator [Telmatospirillum sp.]
MSLKRGRRRRPRSMTPSSVTRPKLFPVFVMKLASRMTLLFPTTAIPGPGIGAYARKSIGVDLSSAFHGPTKCDPATASGPAGNVESMTKASVAQDQGNCAQDARKTCREGDPMREISQAGIAQEILRLIMGTAQELPGSWVPDPPRRDGLSLDGALVLFRRRLFALDRGLTRRELDVCARSLLGMTAEGIALDLDIKKSSVLTYRKRAYARLGISSQTQLFRLLV